MMLGKFSPEIQQPLASAAWGGLGAEEGTLVEKGLTRFGPGFGFGGQAIQHRLDLETIVLDSVAVKVAGDVKLVARNRTGTTARTGDSKLVPCFAETIRAVKATPHRDDWDP